MICLTVEKPNSLHKIHVVVGCNEAQQGSLTSFLSMSQVRRHRHHPPLSRTHPPQALVQPVDHLVRPQQGTLRVLNVISEDEVILSGRFRHGRNVR